MSLAPITFVEPERKLQEALNGWLKGYFDGQSHTIGNETLAEVFPVVELVFNQDDVPEKALPLVHWLFELQPREEWKTQVDKLVTARFTASVFVRVGNGVGATTGKPEFLCRKVAELLRRVLSCSARYVLAQVGLHHVRVLRGPTPVVVAGYQSRLLVVGGELIFDFEF